MEEVKKRERERLAHLLTPALRACVRADRAGLRADRACVCARVHAHVCAVRVCVRVCAHARESQRMDQQRN